MAFKPPVAHRPSVNFAAIFRGIMATLVLALAGSFFLGIVYHFSGLKESSLPMTSLVLLFLGVFGGGLISSRHAGCKGILHGLSVGIIIFLLIWMFTGLFLPGGISFIILAQKLLICGAAGTLGGILGVGL